MFELIKIFSLFLFSPFIFILVLFFIGFFNIINRKTKSGISLILISLITYSCSCNFFVSPLIHTLENNFSKVSEKNIEQSDIYILLGGGISTNKALSSFPTKNAYPRLLKTIELYNKKQKPIYISGGKSFNNKESESSIYKKILIDSGISKEDIFIEESSRNTAENSKYIKEIMHNNNFKSGILITSAYHMPRSMAIFKDDSLIFYPESAGYLENISNKKFLNYLPNFENLSIFNIVLHEYIGRIYYYMRY